MKAEQMNQIGLDAERVVTIANGLNELLSDYQIHYQNLRGFHWNVKGHKFFELHAKFEEMYEAAKNIIDEIAERVLTLGFTPLHTLTDYIANARVKEARNVSNDKDTVKHTISDLQELIEKEREVWSIADEVNDVGTTSILENYIAAQEKNIWMLNSWLNRASTQL
jgi:starvation-inducible DNA-binding protein